MLQPHASTAAHRYLVTLLVQPAGCKVNERDGDLAPLLSHHDILRLQIPVTPVAV